MTQASDFLSVREFAARVGFSRNTIYDWVRDGTLKAKVVGKRKIRIPASEVGRMLEPVAQPEQIKTEAY